MLCKVYCACCSGLDAVTVTVEVEVTDGIQFFLVGLPDSAVKESQQRIGSALNHYGFRIPGKKIVIDRKSTRLNSSHQIISYAVFCLKKKKHTTCNGAGCHKLGTGMNERKKTIKK